MPEQLYKYTIEVTVYSEEPLPDDAGLVEIAQGINDGWSWTGNWDMTSFGVIDGNEVAKVAQQFTHMGWEED